MTTSNSILFTRLRSVWEQAVTASIVRGVETDESAADLERILNKGTAVTYAEISTKSTVSHLYSNGPAAFIKYMDEAGTRYLSLLVSAECIHLALGLSPRVVVSYNSKTRDYRVKIAGSERQQSAPIAIAPQQSAQTQSAVVANIPVAGFGRGQNVRRNDNNNNRRRQPQRNHGTGNASSVMPSSEYTKILTIVNGIKNTDTSSGSASTSYASVAKRANVAAVIASTVVSTTVSTTQAPTAATEDSPRITFDQGFGQQKINWADMSD